MGGHLRHHNPDVLLESTDDRDNAGHLRMTWADRIVSMRIQDTHGVTMHVIPGTYSWGIYLHEYQPGKRTPRLSQLEAALHQTEAGG